MRTRRTGYVYKGFISSSPAYNTEGEIQHSPLTFTDHFSLFLEYLNRAAIAEPVSTGWLYSLSKEQLTLWTAVLGNVLCGVPF